MGKVRGLLIVVLTLLVACTSGGGNGNGVSRDGGASAGGANDGEGVDPNDVGTGAGLITTVCNAILRCNDEAPVIASQQGCQTLVNAAWGCDPAVAGAKVTGLKACADSLAATSCAVLAGSGFPTTECVAAVESLERSLGAVDEGEVCEDAPCVGGAECSASNGECLRCGKRGAKEGQPCNGFECEGSLFCAQNDRCTRQSPVGKACEFPEECETGACAQGVCIEPAVGDDCEDGEQCGNSLGCKSGKCAKLGKPGEACGGEGECTFDAFCVQGRCTSVPSCRSAGLGSVCLFDGQCTSDLVCGDEQCVKPAELGQSCETVPCRQGLTCALDDLDDLDACEVDVERTPEECAAEERDAAVNKSGARRVKPWAKKAFDWAQLRLARGHVRR